MKKDLGELYFYPFGTNEVVFGKYDADGGCKYEMSMVWEVIMGNNIPQIQFIKILKQLNFKESK